MAAGGAEFALFQFAHLDAVGVDDAVDADHDTTASKSHKPAFTIRAMPSIPRSLSYVAWSVVRFNEARLADGFFQRDQE